MAKVDKTKPIQPEVLPKDAKTPQKPVKLSQRDIAYSLLRKEGMNNAQATTALGIVPSRGTQISHKLNKKYDLQEESYLKPAALAVKRILKGKTFGEVKNIKDSTVLAAASMVYDRAQPVVKHNVNINTNVNFTDIPLDGYK